MRHIKKETKTESNVKKIKLELIKDKNSPNRIGEKITCRIYNFLHPFHKFSNNLSAPIFPKPIEPIPYPLPPPLPPKF
jgi:hypothetical protein